MGNIFANPFLEQKDEEENTFEDPFANPFVKQETAKKNIFANPFLIDQPAEASPPPGGVVSEAPPISSSFPLVEPYKNPTSGFMNANQLIVDQMKLDQADRDANNPSVTGADAYQQQLERQRILNEMEVSPADKAFDANLNPTVSGISGNPGNFQLYTPLGEVPISNEDAATSIARANKVEMPNNAFVRGTGRMESVFNNLALQMGLRKPEDYIDKTQEILRLYPDAPPEITAALRKISEAETYGEAFRLMKDNFGAVLSVVGESIPMVIPGLIAATGVTAVTKNPFAAPAVIGTSSFAIEFGNVLDEELKSSGVDLNNDEALGALLQDQEFWARAKKRGTVRGIPIALMDAISMGIAGRLVNMARGTGSRSLIAPAVGGEVISQAGTGGLGELGAQVGEVQTGFRDEIAKGEVALETAADIVPGAGEAAINIATTKVDPVAREARQLIKNIDNADKVFTNTTELARRRFASNPEMSASQRLIQLAERARATGIKGSNSWANSTLKNLNRPDFEDKVTPEQFTYWTEKVAEYESKAAGEPRKDLVRIDDIVEINMTEDRAKGRSEAYQNALQSPLTRSVIVKQRELINRIAAKLQDMGYNYYEAYRGDAPKPLDDAGLYMSKMGSLIRLVNHLNAYQKGYKGSRAVDEERLQNAIAYAERGIDEQEVNRIIAALDAFNPAQEKFEVAPPPDPAATTQTGTVDPPVDLPSAVSKTKPDIPEAPKVEPPKVEPPKVETPQILNPQDRADNLGIDTDDVVKSVQTPDGQKNYNVKGKVVELADLKQAQGELQPRDRSRKESEVLSKERAGTKFNPDRLLDDPTSGSGAPIIARDGTIMSGNGRVLTLQEVYANQPESLSKYRASLEGAGINTEGFSQPVFVRMLTDNMTIADLKEFADLSNTDAQATMSMTERAGRDAKRLTDSKIIELYRGDFDIDAAQNRKFVQEYAKKILSPTEQGAFVDANGVISQEGVARVKNAILGSAFDNTDTLATMLESSDANIKAISNAFMAAAPKFAQLKKQVADGRTEPQWDITPRLAEMANLVSRLRRDNMKVEDYFNQTDMLSAPDPAMEALVRAFYNPDLTRANSTKAMKDFLDFYVEEALQKETGGFLEDTTTPDDVIEAGKKRTEAKRNEGKGQQTGLFESNVQSNETSSQQTQKQPVQRSRQGAGQSDQTTERQVDATKADGFAEQSIEGVAELRNAESASPATAEIREQNTRGTKTGRILIAQSETLRQSLFRDAFAAAGKDPDVMVNRPQTEQFRILRKLLIDKFGFKYIAPPQQGANYDQVNALLDAYHNLQWMTSILKLPNRAIGLEGSLGLALPQRAWGGYMAAYINRKAVDPTSVQSDVVPITGAGIIMPGRSNSFAHEWGHALDFHLVDRLGTDWGRGLTGRIRTNLKKGESAWIDSSPTSVVEAMGDLMNAMFYDDAEVAATIMQMESEIARLEARPKPTKKLEELKRKLQKLREGSTRQKIKKSKYKENSTKYAKDAASDVNYWTRPTEMFARAFEAYVANAVEAAGGSNEFITHTDEAYKLTLDKVQGADERLALTYPKDSERMKINHAMDRLMDALRDTVIQEGTPAQAPGNEDMIDARAEFYEAIDVRNQEKESLWQDQARQWNVHKQERARLKQRPRAYKSTWAAFQDTAGFVAINTKRGYLFNLAARHKDNKGISKHLERIIARISTDPGSTDNRVTVSGGTFEEAVRGASRRYSSRYIDINNKYKIDTFSPEEMEQLRLFLTSDTGVQKGADPNVKKAAGEIRTKILNPMFDYMRKNGLDLNYIPDGGYMPRMMDAILAVADKDGFINGKGGKARRGAKALYYDVIYQNELGVLDEGDADQAKALLKLADQKNIKDVIDAATAQLVYDLRTKIGQIEAESKKLEDPETDPGAIEDNIQQLQEEVTEIHAELYEALREPYSDQAALNWYERITVRQVNDISRNGVQGEFASKRKLPPEADTYMVDYYLNPMEALMQYIPGVARKVEYEKRFGSHLVPKGERKKIAGGDPSSPMANHDFLSYSIEQMLLAGMNDLEAENVRYVVQTVTGTLRRNDKALDKTLNTIHAYGSMAILPRAVLSSIAEPMTAAVQTGNVLDGFKVFNNTIGEAFASIGTNTMKERRQYYRQLGNILGVIDLPESGELIANRVGGTIEESSKISQRMGRFFYRTGLVSLTNAQRRGSMRVGIQYIIELGKQYTNPASDKMKARATEALRDFGVASQDIDQFTEYAANLKKDAKGMYDIDLIMDQSGELTDMGEILAVAIRRFTDQTIQDPKVIDRPAYAETPMGRIVWGIQSFISSFTRNILLFSLKKVQREYKNRGIIAGSEMAFKTAAPLAILVGSHTAVSAVREFLLNRDKWEEEDEEERLDNYLLRMGFSRSGMMGRFDPLYQALYSLRYQSDLTNMLAGATGSYFSKGAENVTRPFRGDNSPNTVAAEYAGVKGAYDLTVPIILSHLASIGGIGKVAGFTMGAVNMAASSPTVKNWAVRSAIYQMYGEEYYPGRRGDRKRKRDKPGSDFLF